MNKKSDSKCDLESDFFMDMMGKGIRLTNTNKCANIPIRVLEQEQKQEAKEILLAERIWIKCVYLGGNCSVSGN